MAITERRTSNRLPPIIVAALFYHTPCSASNLSGAAFQRRALSPSQNEDLRQLFRRETFINRSNRSESSINRFGASNKAVLLNIRGGALPNRQVKSPTATTQQSNKTVTTASIAILSITILFSILNWETLVLSLSTLFDREKFRASIINTLNSISAKGTRGLLLYTFGFIFWETCGLPTSVVETAAGMAFGFQNGLLCSFVGKTLGSILAFALGRSLCQSMVKKQLGENEVLALMEESVARNPIQSALIMRYSPFPQLIKNFGLSMTEPVTLAVFVLAICVHGFPFSVLWAALGNDSSLRLRAEEMGESLDANWILNGALVFVTVFGFVVSPAITGWWIAGLRKEGKAD